MPDLTVWPTDGADGSVSSEARWRKMGRVWAPSGVVADAAALGGASGGLVPTLAAGPTINVTTGVVWADGHFAELTTPASIPATANGLLVVRFTPADNHAELLYRDAATTPTRTDPTYEIPIARMIAGALADARVMTRAAHTGEVATVKMPARLTLAPANTEASPLTVLQITAYCEGTEEYEFTFNSPIMSTTISATGGNVVVAMWQDSTMLGRMAMAVSPATVAGQQWIYPCAGRHRVVPSQGVHVFAARAAIGNTATSGYIESPAWFTMRRV